MKQNIYPLLISQRRRLGFSQQHVAMLAGLRREKVNRVESKSEDISLDELSRLLDAVGLELAVREKGMASSLVPASSSNPRNRLSPKDFREASFVDGSRAKILSWGKVPK